MEINIGIEISNQGWSIGISEAIYLNTELNTRLLTESGFNLIL
jgi:hypothetical protein